MLGRFRPYSREMTSLLHSSPRPPPPRPPPPPPQSFDESYPVGVPQKGTGFLGAEFQALPMAFVLLYEGEEDRKKYCTGE